jgi:hypothetical protein
VLELADIFREAGTDYRRAFASRMLPSHLKAMRDIQACRTPALGGHLRSCDNHCGTQQYSYHSCRNRHCPKCHTDQTRRWLEAQKARLLPCPYFLLTFTLPAELRPLARSHQKQLYPALLSTSARSVLSLAANPRYLGARPGLMTVLHTWTRAMIYHPHAHILVTGGGLAPDGDRWVDPVHPAFLLPGRALSKMFRGKFRAALEKARLIDEAPPAVWHKSWVVHVQQAGSGEKVLEYLSRYLFRIAIANSRLERFENGAVTFRYRDNRSGQIKHCTLPAGEFISRFLQHVLPARLPKVRYHGIYSPSRNKDLERARGLLPPRRVPFQPAPPVPDEAAPLAPDAPVEKNAVELSEDPLCPSCKIGRMRIVALLPRQRDPP